MKVLVPVFVVQSLGSITCLFSLLGGFDYFMPCMKLKLDTEKNRCAYNLNFFVARLLG